MKVLVISFSLGGSTRKVAEEISRALSADFSSVRLKSLGGGFFGYLQIFFWAKRKMSPEILPLDQNPADYDLTVLCTPVFLKHLSPPMRTLLKSGLLQNQKIAILSTIVRTDKFLLSEAKEILGRQNATIVSYQSVITDETPENEIRRSARNGQIHYSRFSPEIPE